MISRIVFLKIQILTCIQTTWEFWENAGSNSVGLRWDPRFCIPEKLPDTLQILMSQVLEGPHEIVSILHL